LACFLTDVLAAALVARREAAKLHVYRHACQSMDSATKYRNVFDLWILHTDTSLDNMLDKNFPLKWLPATPGNMVAMTGYAEKVKSEIMGLCLACMRGREHDKSDACL